MVRFRIVLRRVQKHIQYDFDFVREMNICRAHWLESRTFTLLLKMKVRVGAACSRLGWVSLTAAPGDRRRCSHTKRRLRSDDIVFSNAAAQMHTLVRTHPPTHACVLTHAHTHARMVSNLPPAASEDPLTVIPATAVSLVLVRDQAQVMVLNYSK